MKHSNFLSLSLFFFSFLLFSCNQVAQSEKLYQEVMVIHDEVMPKVHDIQKLSKQLEEKAAQEGLSETEKEEVQKLLSQLETADKAMWDWMSAFKQPDASLSEEKIIELLTIEKDKISNVSEMMLSSIANAQEKLGTK